MSEICVNGDWSGKSLLWTCAPVQEAPRSAEAERLMAFYEEGNLKAQGGDLPRALVVFQKGLSAFAELAEPDAQLKVAEAALLWGLGTALDRTDRDQSGWRTLMEILGPGRRREQIPLGLAINWSHSTTLAGYRHDHYLEVCAMLDALQRLGWGDQLREWPEAVQAVRERYGMLAPFRARCFEGLMQEERFEQAAQVAATALESYRQLQPEQEDSQRFWSSMQEAAAARQSNFRLPQQPGGGTQEGVEPPSPLPAVRLVWDGQGRINWRLGESPEDPHNSALVRLYAQAAQAAERGDEAQAMALYDKGLAAWSELKHPRSCDALVRAMMLWGKGCLQDRASQDGSPHAWETLLKLAQPGQGNALPLPLLLSWTQSSVIVASNLRHWGQAQALLVFLMEMAMHPQVGGHDPEISSQLVQRFLSLLEGTYSALDSQGEPELAADWMRSLQRKVEPAGLILLPLREALFHALSAAGRHAEAEAVATEVLLWARQEDDGVAAQAWSERAQAARAAMA
jgi:hypothetical protein